MDNKYNEYEEEFNRAIEKYRNRNACVKPQKEKLTFMEHSLSFCVAFFVTLISMGIILFGSLYVNRPRNTTQVIGSADIPKSVEYIPSPKDNINLLLAVSESEDYLPETYILVGFLVDRGYISVSLISPNTLVTTLQDEVKLNDLYRSGGVGYAAKGLSEYFNVPIERYGSIYYKDIDSFMSELGDYNYNVTETLNYPYHRRHISLQKGMTLMNGRKFCDILFYPNYKGGEREKSDRGAMLVADFLNDLIIKKGKTPDLDIKTPFFKYIDTNISSLDIETRLDAAKYLSEQNERIVVATYIDGSVDSTYEYFLINRDTLNRIYEIYS